MFVKESEIMEHERVSARLLHTIFLKLKMVRWHLCLFRIATCPADIGPRAKWSPKESNVQDSLLK
jgi:hypothetical protein